MDFLLPFAHCFCSSWPLCFFLCLTWWILSPSLSIDSMISPTERHLRFHSPFLVPYVSWILLCEFSLESLHHSQKWGHLRSFSRLLPFVVASLVHLLDLVAFHLSAPYPMFLSLDLTNRETPQISTSDFPPFASFYSMCCGFPRVSTSP